VARSRGSAKGLGMQLEDQDVVAFLYGENTVRDGYLRSLSIHEIDYQPAVELIFHVPRSTVGNVYKLTMSGFKDFDYCFSLDEALCQIPFVKCLWTEDGYFYLSLDPWKEDERFISEKDNDCFLARVAKLIVE
jgi:hypothetical protein